MSEKPILFSAPMVRAILDGTKTQIRRVVKPQPKDDIAPHQFPNGFGWRSGLSHKYGSHTAHFCPYGETGDLLWVRETWATVNSECGPGFAYRADGCFHQPEYDGPDFGAGPSFNYDKYPGSYTMWYTDLLDGVPCHNWTPSIHMPRWASRITLKVTDVRVQRLQDISEEDAMAEGARMQKSCNIPGPFDNGLNFFTYGFKSLWNSINGAGSWDLNPWVYAITFERMEGK